MVDPVWSWVLMGFAVTAIWVGPLNRWGWAVGLFGQLVWLVYGFQTQQPGFIVSAILLGVAYTKNFALATKLAQTPKTEALDSLPLNREERINYYTGRKHGEQSKAAHD